MSVNLDQGLGNFKEPKSTCSYGSAGHIVSVATIYSTFIAVKQSVNTYMNGYVCIPIKLLFMNNEI